MKYIRARNSVAVDYMADYLLPDDDFTLGSLTEALKQMLIDTPDQVFIGQVWDGDELRAFVIAYAPPSMGHVFVHQAWADAKLQGTSTQDKLFLRACLWAESVGRRELRAETRRNPEAFLRKWGFKPYSQVLTFDVGEDLADRLLEVPHNVVVKKEPEDGSQFSGAGNAQPSRTEPERLGSGGSEGGGESEGNAPRGPAVDGTGRGSTGPANPDNLVRSEGIVPGCIAPQSETSRNSV